jgi:hypothetical protein
MERPHRRRRRGGSMLDLIMLALGLGGFALMIAYVALCERL